jgi:ribosomal protein L34
LLIVRFTKIIDFLSALVYNLTQSKGRMEVYIIMKRTFQPNNSKKSKTSGFLARRGSNVLKSRRAKGRKELAK